MNAISLTIKPDLKTRESVMAAAGRVQLSVTSKVTGRTIYLRLRAVDATKASPLESAHKVFIDERGYGTPYIGRYSPFSETLTTSLPATDPHVWALRQAVNLINGAPVHPQVSIAAEDLCGLCGRRLIDPISVARGLGPECAGKPTGTKILHCSAFNPKAPIK